MLLNSKVHIRLAGLLFSAALTPFLWPQSQTTEKKVELQPGIVPMGATGTPDMGRPEMFVGMELGFEMNIVRDHPFSSRVIVENERRLDDGNLVRRESQGKLYRDSSSHVRFERIFRTIGPGGQALDGLTFVTIFDRAGQVIYQLLPSTKTGIKVTLPPGLQIPPRMQPGGLKLWPNEPNFKTEPIGFQTIEGFRAEGLRVTKTIPAGAEGNAFPIEVIREVWYSPELQLNVLVKQIDPRSGETVYRLADVVQEEPLSTLFRVPDDYKLQESSAVPLVPPNKPKLH